GRYPERRRSESGHQGTPGWTLTGREHHHRAGPRRVYGHRRPRGREGGGPAGRRTADLAIRRRRDRADGHPGTRRSASAGGRRSPTVVVRKVIPEVRKGR